MWSGRWTSTSSPTLRQRLAARNERHRRVHVWALVQCESGALEVERAATVDERGDTVARCRRRSSRGARRRRRHPGGSRPSSRPRPHARRARRRSDATPTCRRATAPSRPGGGTNDRRAATGTRRARGGSPRPGPPGRRRRSPRVICRRRSASVPAIGGCTATPTTSSPRAARDIDERSRPAVASQLGREFDDHPTRPAVERIEMLDSGRRSARARWSPERCSVGVSTTAVSAVGEALQFVDRADRDRVAELGGHLGEPQPPEPVSVALDDRDQPGRGVRRSGRSGSARRRYARSGGRSPARR